MDSTPSARCRCGQVTLKASRDPFLQLTCHCGQCREASGHPFTNLVFFKRSAVEVSGTTVETAFTADSGAHTVRQRCPACGDLMFDLTDGFPALIGVVAERLAPPFAFTPRAHVWLDSAVAVPEVPEGVARHARGLS